MPQDDIPGNAAVGPDDLKMMDQLLEQWCHDSGHDKSSSEAEDAARELVIWFQFGVKTQRQLQELLYSRG